MFHGSHMSRQALVALRHGMADGSISPEQAKLVLDRLTGSVNFGSLGQAVAQQRDGVPPYPPMGGGQVGQQQPGVPVYPTVGGGGPAGYQVAHGQPGAGNAQQGPVSHGSLVSKIAQQLLTGSGMSDPNAYRQGYQAAQPPRRY